MRLVILKFKTIQQPKPVVILNEKHEDKFFIYIITRYVLHR
jgi:hypothetical protein